MDGFSRRILRLEVKKPSVIASHYLNAVLQLEGVPRQLRKDRVTGNAITGNLQRFFPCHDPNNFEGSASFLEGKSCGNQRIEAWWSKFREGAGGWWMNLFRDLRDAGFNRDDCLIKECLKFCFLPVFRRELCLIVELWNTHNIQRQTRCKVEGGKPDVMFFTPEIHGKENYLVNVDMQDVEACQEIYAENCVDYNENFEKLVRLIKSIHEPPSSEQEALQLYIEITDCLENV